MKINKSELTENKTYLKEKINLIIEEINNSLISSVLFSNYPYIVETSKSIFWQQILFLFTEINSKNKNNYLTYNELYNFFYTILIEDQFFVEVTCRNLLDYYKNLKPKYKYNSTMFWKWELKFKQFYKNICKIISKGQLNIRAIEKELNKIQNKKGWEI